jgi:hypothetical protein
MVALNRYVLHAYVSIIFHLLLFYSLPLSQEHNWGVKQSVPVLVERDRALLEGQTAEGKHCLLSRTQCMAGIVRIPRLLANALRDLCLAQY